MRISDWSSDVCSSDLPRLVPGRFHLQDLFADKMNDFRIATWQGLGRGKDGRKLKYLSKKAQDGVWNIKQAAKALKTRWARLRQNDAALARLALAFAAAPVRKTAHWTLADARTAERRGGTK